MADSDFHNALGGNSADQLRAYVTRIERLEEEIAALNDDKREVYAETRACGFDKAIMRKLIQRRRKDRSELKEEDELLDLYEAALLTVDERRDPLD